MLATAGLNPKSVESLARWSLESLAVWHFRLGKPSVGHRETGRALAVPVAYTVRKRMASVRGE